MNSVLYNKNNKSVIDSILLKIPGVVSGKMFGYPAYYINKKLFACIYENGVGLKIPEKLAIELIGKNGITHFQPMGKSKMREWIQLNRNSSNEFTADKDLFLESIQFVSQLEKHNR